MLMYSVSVDSGDLSIGYEAWARPGLGLTEMRARLEGTPSLRGVTAEKVIGVALSWNGRAEAINAEVVAPNFFAIIGLAPLLGDAFTTDVREGNWFPEAVLSYAFWQSHFGGDPRAVGSEVRLNGYPFRIVGITPQAFTGLHQGQDVEMRIPALRSGSGTSVPQLGIGTNQEFGLLGRLAPDNGRLQAQAEVNSRLQAYIQTSSDHGLHPRYDHLRLELEPGERGWTELASTYGLTLALLCGCAAVALLIASLNVANMMLLLGARRRKEFAIRAAMGAQRAQLGRKVILEGLTISWAAGILSLALAEALLGILPSILPSEQNQQALRFSVNSLAIITTFILCTGTGLCLGVAGAIQAIRTDIAGSMKTGLAGSTGTASRVRSFLVATQTAFSAGLLVVAGLFIRTELNLLPRGDYPNAGRVLAITIRPPHELYSGERVRLLAKQFRDRISALPFVEAAGIAENGPFARRADHDTVQVPGRPAIEAVSDTITPGFLRSIGSAVVQGRDFSDGDNLTSPPVVIVSEMAARILFPNETPIGKTVQLPSARGTVLFPVHGILSYEVIGVVRDLHYASLREAEPDIFFTFQRDPPDNPMLYVRVKYDDPFRFAKFIGRELDQIDTGVPILSVTTLEGRIKQVLGRERAIVDLSAILGGMTLLLAAVGLYGVVSFSVARRTPEFCIRIALGSAKPGVLWLVCRESLLIVGTGTLAGGCMAVACSRVFAGFLYGVSPVDWITICGVAMSLLVAGLAGTLLPATRAMRIDPAQALRWE